MRGVLPPAFATLLGEFESAQLVDQLLEDPQNATPTLLFYTCVTKEVKNQCEESYTLDQAESANVGFTSNFTTIEQGHQVGIASFFAVHDIFFDNGKGMRADWEARWTETSQKLKPLIEARSSARAALGAASPSAASQAPGRLSGGVAGTL